MRPWFVALCLVACGGSAPKKPPVEPVQPTVTKEAEPPPPAPPPEKEPVILHAKAEMTPTKGSKVEPFVVGFMQREGDNALVLADLPVGVKAGRYHYVIHDSADCAKPGGPWAETKDIALVLVVLADLTGALDNTELAVHLDGENALVEDSHVLHDDKKGKPGKALACGTIKKSEE
jgi:hypothetical protein